MLIRMLHHLPSRWHSVILLIPILAVFFMKLPHVGFAQTNRSAGSETVQDLISRLTPEQKQLFDQAMMAFNAQRYPDALAFYKQMLTQLRGDPVISKFAAEAALNAGDLSFAMTVLKPLAAADPNDWQAAALLTRACAESGDTTCRDSGIAHMMDLRRRGITPPSMQQYTLERVKAGENTLLIRTSLEPWGYYKIYDLGQVSDKDNKV